MEGAMRRYCKCGRKIVVFKCKGYRGVKQGKDDHDLCQKCWKSERDSRYWIPDMRRVFPR